MQLGGNIGTPVLSLDPPRMGRYHVVEVSSFQIDLAPSHRSDGRHSPQRHARPSRPPRHDRALCRAQGAAGRGGEDRGRRGRRRHLPGGRRPHRAGTAAASSASRRGGRWRAASSPTARCSTSRDDGAVEAVRHRSPASARSAASTMRRTPRRRSRPCALARPRPTRRSSPACAASAACRTAWRRSAAAAAFSSSTIPRRPTPTPRRRRSASFDRIYWIAGGRPKEGGIDGLVDFFPRIAKAYLIGEAMEAFAATLAPTVPVERSGTLAAARRLRGARRGARPCGGAGGAAVAGLRVLRPVPEFRAAGRRLPRARAVARWRPEP